MTINVVCRKDAINRNRLAPLALVFTHDRRRKFVGLGISVALEHWDFEKQQPTTDCPDRAEIQFQITSKIREYEKKIKKLEVLEIPVTFDNLFEQNGKRINCTVGDFFRQIIDRLEKVEKYGSASKHKVTLALMQHFKSTNMRFDELDLTYLREFEIFLRQRGNVNNSLATKFSVLKAVYNKAVSEGVFVPKSNPFQQFKVGSLWTNTRKRAITKEDIHRLIELDLSGRDFYTQLAKDIFLFSYFMAGINFKDKDGIQIMKDYMASGSFARGKEEKSASASMVFVGNINQSVDVLLKTSSLFAPFPPEMGTDTAFLDRMHCYIPGWEIPKFRPQHFTNDYGFISDYLAEFIRELRKEQYGDALDKYFRLGKNLNQRDTIAVRKMVGGFIKLLYPDGEYTKEELEEVLKISLEMRRRVKEQLKKLGGMEFYDVNFSYIDNETFEEFYVSVPEQGGGKLIPEGMCNPGQVYTVAQGKTGMLGVFRLESQMMPGNGKFERSGLGSDGKCKEATNTAFNFLKANSNRISGSISTTTKDYIINYQDLQGIGMTDKLALPTLIALSSVALGKPVASSLAVLGEISIAGTLIKVDELANSLQVCLDSGAKKVLLPIVSAADIGAVPSDLIGCFNLIFYSSAEDAVYKALGVE